MTVLPTGSTGGPVRLRMARLLGRNTLDGGWWPRTRGLGVELAALLDQLPTRYGEVKEAWVSAADWGSLPTVVTGPDGVVQVRSSPPGQPHLLRLITRGRGEIHLLVVPHRLTRGKGEDALLAAATHGNAHSALELLVEVTDHPEVAERDLWVDHAPAVAAVPRPNIAPTARERRGSLTRLLARVELARGLEQAQAHGARIDRYALRTAQEATFDALLHFADALEELCWPVPRGIQLEIQMHRIVCGRRNQDAGG
ncbi:hypothetical protein GCM10028801_05810 [Nocardioides maradonensis]